MKLNQEITVLLETIKSFLGKENDLNQSIFKGINWQKLEKALNYHSIRPIFLEQIKKHNIDIPADLLNRLEVFSRSQAIVHLNNLIEVKEIEKDFANKAIPIVNFKGVTYQNELYKKSFREAGDIDLLINREALLITFQLLINRGYVFSNELSVSEIDKITKDLILDKDSYEVSLNDGVHHIDLHWDIRYGFLPYKIPENFILTLNDEKDRIFWTMINHHGAKEFWLKLKYIIDFKMFLTRYQNEMDWTEVLIKSQKFGTKTVLLNGFILLKERFDISLPPIIEKELTKHNYLILDKTYSYWNKALPWNNPVNRFYYERILLKSQDKGFDKIEYFKNFYRYYTVPNEVEAKRFINFPNRFKFLNFLSKVFSYLIKKTFGLK